MKNNYIKLFERLAKQKPGELTHIKKFEDLGFFLTNFKRLHEERYVFLEEIKKFKDKKKNSIKYDHQVKLAPRGFASLEEYYRNERQEKNNESLLKATIIIAVATALNVLVNLFLFLLDLDKKPLIVAFSLAVIGIFIAGLAGILIKEVWNFLFPKKIFKK